MRVRFTRRAFNDLMAQVDWLEQFSPDAARRASQSIQDTLAWLADYPLAAPRVDADHRDVAVRFGRDGFFIRYRIDREDLVVVRVFHG
ncbi:type II toxin-antitoxin system RelE/ParE family toxin [Phenylobacterium aquaticum]|nr:type II toxin-antitoxin system RelE/ParE family toxin [Phenylobacterium aquaticum]